MITMQQLEELENRVIKALHLIGDLRTENSKLENENEVLKGEVEEVKLSLEEKEQEIERIKKELDATALELKELTQKEEVLEKKIISLLGKLDILQGSAPVQDTADRHTIITSLDALKKPSVAVPEADVARGPLQADDVIVIEDEVDDKSLSEELRIETVDSGKAEISEDEDDDIIIIDDEDEIDEKIALKGRSNAPVEEDDEIILLDDEDEIVIDDFDKKDNLSVSDRRKSDSTIDDDDDIIIIEDDEK